jgi:lipid-binding SYLF domain-containing protein
MRHHALTGLLIVGLTATLAAQSGSKEIKRVEEAAAVLNELSNVPDKDIPHQLWENAKCAIVVPGLKRGAFVVGGEYGKGIASCRTGKSWSAPVFFEMEKGSWGFQVGAESVDLILLVMNERGMEKLLSNKVSLGTEATVAAGPVGRDAAAATDAAMQAEILAYSRSRGLFAGININGGVLRPDPDGTKGLYGKEVSAAEVLKTATATAPPGTMPFLNALRRHDLAATTGKK